MTKVAHVSPTDVQPRRYRLIGRVVAGSLIGGLLTAIMLVAFVAPGAEEHVITGSVMIASGLGWALLALLSVRLTDQPQRWAFVPAAYMLLVGAVLVVLAPSPDTLNLLGWVWPPVLLAMVVWMIVQARRHLRSRTRRWILYPVFGFLAMAAVGGAYVTVREAPDRSALQVPGQLIDVGGHRLYVNCTGSGNPTVVMEAGLGETSAYWERIAAVVAREARVCVYDRAGRGHSEPAPDPQDGLAIAADLRRLLEGAQEDGPYVMVGHSSGGVYVRIFASEYPDEVAGMVLLDAQPVEALTRLPSYPRFYRVASTVSALLPSLARLGVSDIALARSVRNEWAELPTALQQGATLTSLGDRPLMVVTAVAGAQTGWLPLQEEMVTLSSNGGHRVLPDATHTSLITAQDDAAVSSGAILDVVESVRTGMPLANL